MFEYVKKVVGIYYQIAFQIVFNSNKRWLEISVA